MKKKYVYFVILFIFSIFFKFFENAYIVFKNNHEVRLISNYGFCDKSSYGFIKYIDKKYNFIKNIEIINDEIHPSSESFIYKPKLSYYKDNLILLNYDDRESKINIKEYTIIEKIKNCYYLKKND